MNGKLDADAGVESTFDQAHEKGLSMGYGDAPRTRRLFELMVQHTVLAAAEHEGPENTMVDTSAGREIIKYLRNEGRVQGRSEGRIEGEMRASTRIFERRLARALTPDEQATLSARFEIVGPDRLCDLVFDLDAAALAAWLADPAAT
jgi:hypothetical protein